MNRFLTLFLFLSFIACQSEKVKPIYLSESFSIFPDRVVQGDNESVVHSPNHISSDYRSPASETFSRLILFKFSINEKDNEAAPGNDHWLLVGDEKESPVIVFGEAPSHRTKDDPGYLPPNYEYTFRVDMRPVLDQFDEKGFYEAYDGTRVAKSDFKGFYIAGSAEPLTWDFVNLENRGLKLEDEDGDKIYEITLVLNPYNPEDFAAKDWKLSLNISDRPTYQSEQPLVDALFNMSLEEAIKNIEADSTLRTGAKWGGVWTRDISYSIFLAFAYHEPEIAKISLMKKVKRNRIIQDTGSGGAWPVSSDRSTWALAAWEIFKVTGDQEWLETSFQIIRNSVEDDYLVIGQTETGMYAGESSFLDWREQTYPKWMSNMDIYVSQNLGTNVVHYQTHRILAEMAIILGEPYQTYVDRADRIKEGINSHLWMENVGYYGQYLYGRPNLSLSPRFEALGEALAILFDVAGEDQAKTIIGQSPLTAFGATCIYPQIPGIPPYHNNGIWPFVQSYWNLAAAKAGNEEVLNHGLASIYRAAGLFLTNYENMVAHTGDFLGTEINSDRMLWSMAGNLAMVHRVFIGMSFEIDGLRFAPVIPSNYGGSRSLSNFHYRDAVLDITVVGHGNQIEMFSLDGEVLETAFLPASISGSHEVKITMANNDFSGPINLVDNHFSLKNPNLTLDENRISWESVEGAERYLIYKDGALFKETTELEFEAPSGLASEYKVSTVDSKGFESFTSEPLMVNSEAGTIIFEMESFADKSDLPFSNYSDHGFIEITRESNPDLSINLEVKQAGWYQVDIRYSNGSGPWNTDNKCAIRSLYQGSEYVGSVVFPQRGTDEWSDWGNSNSYRVFLEEGPNPFRLVFEEWNNNMNVDVNRAMLDYIQVILLEQ